MTKIVFSLCAVVMTGSLSFSQPANRIDESLSRKLEQLNDNDVAQVIIVLADQVDVNALHNVFRATRPSKHERHYQVVTALQSKAVETQGPLLNLLTVRQSVGDVESFEPMWIVNMILARPTKRTVLELSTRDDIQMIFEDGLLALDAPVDQSPAGMSPGAAEPNLRAINAHKLWELGYTGEGSLVMNIDTGVNGAHPALSSRWRGNVPGVQWYHAWYDQKSPPSPVPVDYGSTKHGSHTMGIMMGLDGATADTIGVAPGAMWIASPTIDVGFSPHTSYTLRAFQWAADPDSNVNTSDDVPDVISNSYQDPNVSSTQCNGASGYWAAVDALEAIGTAVVWSAGNSGPGAQTHTPPKNRITTNVNFFAVGNLNTSTAPPWVISNSSSRGPSNCDGLTFKPEVVAPGTSIRSALSGSSYGNLSGTSMASPHVAGAIALLRSIAPFLTGTEIKEILYNTAVDYGTTGEDNTYGKGLIDLWAAYQVLPLSMGYVRGQITSASNPLPGVQIDFVESVQQIGSTTVADGMFFARARIDTPSTSAQYTIRARKFGYLTYTDTITLQLADTVVRDIEMMPLDLVLTKSDIVFSQTPVPGMGQDSLVARNQGTGTLTLSSLTTTNPVFTVSPTGAEIPAGDSIRIYVTYTPVIGGSDTGRVVVMSSSTLTPRVDVVIEATSVGIPHIAVEPDSFFLVVASGNTVDGSVTVRSTGLGELMYTSRVDGGFVGEDSAVVGSPTTSLATSSGLLRGGVVRISTSVQLNEIRTWLNMTAARELRFVVYDSTSGTGFTKIFESVVSNPGTGGPKWYSSGPVNITLEAGKKYAIGVGWQGLSGLTYHYQLSSPVPVPVAFGTITGGLAQSGFPPPTTITQGATSTLYYTQLVTSSGQWLGITSGGTGTLTSGDSSAVNFRVYTGLLAEGLHTAAVKLTSNDPERPTVTVPVAVNVVLTDVASSEPLSPEKYELRQNYPNPFNPTTTIKYCLPVESAVTLRLYNILGQEVVVLVGEIQKAGYYAIVWDGRNSAGSQVTTGVYFLRIEARPTNGGNGFIQTKKMILMK
jgi:subtilisin family serine protease